MGVRDTETGDGVLVISVWQEQGAENGFRARLVYGPAEEQPVSTVASDPADVLAAVQTWLRQVTG
jgi:hypothetical protein